MEPISAAASVVTLLGVTGGACKAIYHAIIDFNDAPHDLLMQSKKLESLCFTITSLVQLCEQQPKEYPLDLHLCGIHHFISDVKSLELKLKSKETQLHMGKAKRVRESCKWLLFDRQLRKFFDSLEHWNIVLSQALWVAQITLSNRILKQMLSITREEQQVSATTAANVHTSRATIQGAHVNNPSEICLESPVIKVVNAYGGHIKSTTAGVRLFTFLSQVSHPIGILSKHNLRIDNGSISLNLCGGRVMLKSWTKNGTETLTILPQSRGYACVAAIQPWCITRWSLVISFFIYKAESFSLNLRLRCDFQLRRILPFQSSSFVAIARGDIAYLQQQLSAGELALTDCGNRGFTLLHLAVRYSQLPIISMLINQGLDVNSVNDLGETPLHTAVQQSSNYECVRHLLDNGADLGRQDMKGRTPLHGYYNNISQQILLFNQDEVDPWIQDSQGMTILHWVSRSRKSTLQSLLLSSPLQQANTASPFKLKDIQGKSMLHYAVQRGNLELINFFLASPYADSMSMPDHLGRTLLHYATESSQVGIVIDLLLERGLDLNAEDDNRYTVMHHAAMRDNATAVQYLLDLSPNRYLGRKDCDGKTPLQVAQAYRSRDVISILELHNQGEDSSGDGVFEKDVAASYSRVRVSMMRCWRLSILVVVLCLLGVQMVLFRTSNIL